MMSLDREQSLIRRCARATGLTPKEVARIASLGPKRYKVYQIPKRSGGQRTICHPSGELKALQYVFLRDILQNLPVSEAATAYRTGTSIKQNAIAHVRSRVLLKLDFEDFFPSIKVNHWSAFVRETLPMWTDEDIDFSSYVMFWGEGGYRPASLSIGAPTSPFISNALMHKFDQRILLYAKNNELIYTRYADDIAISSKRFLDKDATLSEVQSAIDYLEYPRLRLNTTKMRFASKSASRRVTGIVLANDETISLGRDRKRLISSMVHHTLQGRSDTAAATHLAGLLSFASDVEPTFVDNLAKKYGKAKVESLQLRGKGAIL